MKSATNERDLRITSIFSWPFWPISVSPQTKSVEQICANVLDFFNFETPSIVGSTH